MTPHQCPHNLGELVEPTTLLGIQTLRIVRTKCVLTPIVFLEWIQ
jgi:hypothetical protein